MIRIFATLLAGALWLTGCSAPDPFAGKEWPAAAPALWQVTSPSGEKAWLFGTMHALPDGLEWQSDAVTAAFDEADMLVVEIANLTDGAASSAAFNHYAYLDEPVPIAGRHDPQLTAALRAIADDAGQDIAALAPLKDWSAAITLASVLRIGDPANGADRALIAAGKPTIIGLESFDAQFAIFDGLSADDQASFLRAVVLEESRRDAEANFTAWLTGDLDHLEAESATGILADPSVRSALLTTRNHAWTQRITSLMAQGAQPFIAVGAGHMLGEEGLPGLLEARGFTVARLQ